MQIQGEITKFRSDIGVGVIRAENGRKYRFSPSDIVNASHDLVGSQVDFIAQASRPSQIIVLKGSPFAVFGTAGRA